MGDNKNTGHVGDDKENVRIVPSSHPDKVRMLVLETADLHPEFKKEYDGFGNILGEVFKQAGEEHDPKLGIETVIRYIVEDKGGKVPTADDIGDDIHAILITGSMYDAHEDVEWIHKLMALIKDLWVKRPDIRFSGICFGHQILCRTLGSKVEKEPNGEWEVSHTAINLTEVGRKIFNLPENKNKIHLHQMHQDYVVAAPEPTEENKDLLPPGTKVHVWGKSEHTGVQGCYINKRLFTSQGHMELNEDLVKSGLEKRVEAGAMEEDKADAAAERAHWVHDGQLVAKAVLRFFHGDDDKVE
ncbi:class I glutamine amidotransferase-like protein [Sporormia fimetaria CBS 119925]|uniref:Class I glutamine amidotransferase-like protein n=1 Tax=Sporormia fimetaria CBS 119925 TaxID=1340428 RepID=A0A6A6VKA9_9PLEO|nr:class I glutamine amidotransferase-like protein [Sporormia fimetaria CBS 119925]